MAENLDTVTESKVSRPTGVSVLIIYAVIFAGLFPFVFSIILYFSDTLLLSDMTSLIWGVALASGVMLSAIGAWRGNNRGRIAFLVCVIIHYVLIGINNYDFINSGLAPADEIARMWGRVIRGALYPAFYIWYFFRPETKAFYGVGPISKLPQPASDTYEQ